MSTQYINWNEYHCLDKWHSKQRYYGKAFNISRNMIIAAIVLICIITPFTNWLIPIASKIIKTGLTIRWG